MIILLHRRFKKERFEPLKNFLGCRAKRYEVTNNRNYKEGGVTKTTFYLNEFCLNVVFENSQLALYDQ